MTVCCCEQEADPLTSKLELSKADSYAPTGVFAYQQRFVTSCLNSRKLLPLIPDEVDLRFFRQAIDKQLLFLLQHILYLPKLPRMRSQ